MNYKPGHFYWHHEDGEVFEVELLKIIADKQGEQFYLRVTGNYKRKNPDFRHFKKDDEFSIWRGCSKLAKLNSGWHLRDE